MPEQKKKTDLELAGEAQRKALLPINTYNEGKAYSDKHANALSDGDDKGMGENGTIGSKTDIAARQNSTKVNKFNESNKYPNF